MDLTSCEKKFWTWLDHAPYSELVAFTKRAKPEYGELPEGTARTIVRDFYISHSPDRGWDFVSDVLDEITKKEVADSSEGIFSPEVLAYGESLRGKPENVLIHHCMHQRRLADNMSEDRDRCQKKRDKLEEEIKILREERWLQL